MEHPDETGRTPELSHLWWLRLLDRTGLSPWLLGFGGFLALTIIAVVMLIIVRYPDPAMYRNSIAFTAIISFFLVFYFSMGRGWYRDLLSFLDFDPSLERFIEVIIPSRKVVYIEMSIALLCAIVNLQINQQINLDYSLLLAVSFVAFYFLEYLSIDVVLRELLCVTRIAQNIRIDLIRADFYSTLANIMVRNVGLYIFGLCIISLSYIVFTEGTLSFSAMLLLMMPWYLPGLILIACYLVPYNQFRKRLRSRKEQELNCVSAALAGNYQALDHSLLRGEQGLSKIDLLMYQDRIRAIREWPFTDRIRALVLFGILPPLTWVIAALIEISIEGAL